MRKDSFRVAMRLAYNGGAFYGFQSQKGEKSVATKKFLKALEYLVKLSEVGAQIEACILVRK